MAFGNLIAGQWAGSDSLTLNRNPSDPSDVIGEYAQASAAQLHEAVAAAQAAFPAWSTGSIQARSDALDRIGCEILARKEILFRTPGREHGDFDIHGVFMKLQRGIFEHVAVFVDAKNANKSEDCDSSNKKQLGLQA